MPEIRFATTNKGKAASIRDALEEKGISVVVVPLDMPEPRSDDVRLIAREKVRFAYQQIRQPCIALDSGFYIPALNGFPKAFVNFALETIGIQGILKLMEGKPRECKFRNCIAYLDRDGGEPVFFEAFHKGVLAEKARGKLKEHDWSALSLVFIPDGEEKTLGEMTPAEHQAWRSRQAHSSTGRFAEWFARR